MASPSRSVFEGRLPEAFARRGAGGHLRVGNHANRPTGDARRNLPGTDSSWPVRALTRRKPKMPVGTPQGAGAPPCTMVRPLPDIRLEQSGHCALSARHPSRREGGEDGMRAIPWPEACKQGPIFFALNLAPPAAAL